MPNDKIKVPTYKETTFIGLWKHDKAEPFCFPFIASVVSIGLVYLYELKTKDFTISQNIFDIKNELFSLAVSSLGITLAALSLVIVIYSDDIKRESFSNGAYQQFLFPYILNAVSWTILAVISFFSIIIDKSQLLSDYSSISRVTSYFLLFLTIYSILYTIRIIGSVISNSLLSSFIIK